MTCYDLHTITGQLHSQTHLIISIIIIIIVVIVIYLIIAIILIILFILVVITTCQRQISHHGCEIVF